MKIMKAYFKDFESFKNVAKMLAKISFIRTRFFLFEDISEPYIRMPQNTFLEMQHLWSIY